MITIGNGQFHVGDCLDVMRGIPDASVDMILCDLPYGTTQNKWDSVIPFAPLWEAYWRVAKPNAAIVLTAAQPFASILTCSQIDRFRHEWTWEKTAATGFLNAKKAPLKAHEAVLVFSIAAPFYFPQKTQGHLIKRVNASFASHGTNYAKNTAVRGPYESTERYPRDVLLFPKDNRLKNEHPTQKPVALFEYLIRTYTNEGDTVLDNCAGSGTTAIAAENAKRRWMCIERDQDYATKAVARIRKHVGEVDIFG